MSSCRSISASAGLEIGGVGVKVFLFVATLGYSRRALILHHDLASREVVQHPRLHATGGYHYTMGDWYRVVKTIKGHSYIYEQQTYREGRRVRTRNRYIGPDGGDRGSGSSSSGDSASVTVTTTTIVTGATSFGKAMLDQFGGIDVWGQAALAQLGMSDAKSKRVKVVTTTKHRHKQKIFLGEKDGKKHYLIIEGTEDGHQTVPIGEVWLVPDA